MQDKDYPNGGGSIIPPQNNSPTGRSVVSPTPSPFNDSPIASQRGTFTSRYDALLRNSSTPTATTLRSPSSSSITSENSPAAWSSAVGPAATTGKSGRVIERLMSENDRLKRDLNAKVNRCLELEKSLQTYKPQIEALRQENDNLSHARGVDSGLISRRDRKIEELKNDLALEKERRERAEKLSRKHEAEKEEIEERNRREMRSLNESTKHATTHADILETSHKQLSAEYRARAEAWRKEFSQLQEGREHDRQKLTRMDVANEHMRQELERTKKSNGEICDACNKLRVIYEEEMQSARKKAELASERAETQSAEMEKVVKEMRWLMGVKRSIDEKG